MNMEPWYKIIEKELSFYLAFDQYVTEIKNAISERENEVSYPQTFFNDIGELVRVQQSVENQVIERMERRERFERKIVRAHKRRQRFIDAINQLNEKERLILLNTGPIPESLLEKVYIIYLKDRADIETELKKEYKAQFTKGVHGSCWTNYPLQKKEE